MPAIPFVKASACGNDFILIEGKHAPADVGELTQKICDPHFGVGADGVEWLFPADDADIQARLFNADGSEAEISGNGTRCVSAWLASQLEKETITVRTGAGLKTSVLTRHEGMHFEFKTDMGEPQVGEEGAIRLADSVVRGIQISMGNPHFVVFVDGFALGWQVEAAEIGKHRLFKHGVNVELVIVNSKRDIDVRIYERGVGETQSSGTGSCAAAVAAIATERAQSPVQVASPGGVQTVRWDKTVTLYGPADLICQGEFFV